MEEDLKILERRVKDLKLMFALTNPELKAIENLIKRVKELELENTALENTRNMCPHMKTSGISCNYKDSIPKSKIREKIEEWDKSIKWANADDRYYAIKILQDLLEDK